MEETTPLVISISRLKGCGGAYLGQRIAHALGIMYVDRQLVSAIAKQVEAPIEYVESLDERIPNMWESMIDSLSGSNPWLYNPPPMYPQPIHVSRMESEAIIKLASEKSAVIVGRGASYLLRQHPHHISFFLFASKQFRAHRLQEVYGISQQEATQTVEKVDSDRARYNKSISGTDMFQATQYQMSLDTGILGMENAESVMLQYIRTRFPDALPNQQNLGNDKKAQNS